MAGVLNCYILLEGLSLCKLWLLPKSDLGLDIPNSKLSIGKINFVYANFL